VIGRFVGKFFFLSTSKPFFKVELDGLTGRIKFDQQGLRTGFYLQIIELKKSGLQQVNTILQTEKE
jgi:hypothetical protein